MDNKTKLRSFAKNIRKNTDIDSISKSIVTNIENLGIFKSSKNIMIFYPLKNEINILDLLKNNKKKFFLPRMTKNYNLECCPFSLDDKLVEKKYNVKEPLTKAFDKSILDLVITPALCVDMKGNRIGYGAGFYDRFFEGLGCNILVPIIDRLILNKIPTEQFDKKINFIVSERRIIKV